jgi:ribose 5-phosphate isomerase B
MNNTIKKKLIIGCDHAAYILKSEIIKYLKAKECYEIIDVGCESEKSVDYPDYAEKACIEVLKDETNNLAILICGTGIGISIAANKIPGIRCALCHDHTTAKLTRDHNNANVIAMGARIVGTEVAKDIIDAFLMTDFSNGESHLRRIGKIKELETKYK